MSDIRPYAIDVSADQIKDLHTRLAMTRWPDKETPSDWTQGVPLAYMKELQDYWLNQYDWPARQALLNQWPGFITDIDDLDIHFLHIRSPHSDASP
ncbi:MAG: hypothetical protein ACI81O_001449, partial [Cyclobacteriaceae bacterium]